jgi:hypothetical protein
MKPTVGRIVHFVDPKRPDVAIAAIIVRVWSDTCVNLQLFQDSNALGGWETSVLYDENASPAARAWHWPPKV